MNDLPAQESSSVSLTKVEYQPPAPAIGFDLEAIFKQAVDTKAGVEVLERLLVIRREMRDERAKEQFNEAMRQFQAECPPIKKTVGVRDNADKLAYHYAPIEKVAAHIKPYCEKYGFSYDFDTDTSSVVGFVIAICNVKHVGGHRESRSVKLPLSAGTRMMSATQVFAGTLTFANRRALQNSFGLTLEGEDNDGADASKRPKPDGPMGGSAKPEAGDIVQKRRLIEMTRGVHMVARGYALDEIARGMLTQWLIDENLIEPTESVGTLVGSRLRLVVDKVEAKLKGAK